MKTIEEKKKLITDFKASGLSMIKWCKEQGIATSTMSKWIKKYAPQQKKAKFIEIPKTIREKEAFELSRQNLSNWIIKGASLLRPLYNILKKSLMNEELLHADETVLEVLNEPGRTATSKSYVWLSSS